jgi:hypothetical protein
MSVSRAKSILRRNRLRSRSHSRFGGGYRTRFRSRRHNAYRRRRSSGGGGNVLGVVPRRMFGIGLIPALLAAAVIGYGYFTKQISGKWFYSV